MNERPEQAAPFITRVRVTDFRSIVSCDVELGPLVVLLGANAAGKSNFLDAIRFVVDALTVSPRRAIEQRGGLDALLHRSTSRGSSAAPYFEIALDFAPRGVAVDDDRRASATYTLRIGPAVTSGGDPVVVYEALELPERLEAPSFRISMDPDGTRRRDGWPDASLPADSLWFAIVGSSDNNYAQFFRALAAPRFYELDSDVLRDLDRDVRKQVDLGPHGEHVGWILDQIAEQTPGFKRRLDDYLGDVVPAALGADQRREGRFSTIEARFWTGDPVLGYWEAVNEGRVGPGDPNVLVTLPETLSEGTLLAAGLLVVLFQPGVTQCRIPLIAIEEPETAIHPSYVVSLFDALHDASLYAQLIITTQSAELLESEYVELDQLRLVENVEGVTRIDEVDDGARKVIARGLATVGELHRQRQLGPSNPPSRGDGRDE